MNKLKTSVLSMKWAKKYIKSSNEDIQKDVDYLKEKYKMMDEDYIKMVVGLQFLGTREYVNRTFGGNDDDKSKI